MEIVEPVRQDDRIASVDALRGFSLLGILLLNIASFGLMPHTFLKGCVRL